MRKKDIIELIITGVLIVVLGLLVSRELKGGKQMVSFLRTQKLKEASPLIREKGEEKRLYLALEEEAGKLKLERDPFFKQPIVLAGDSSHGLRLSGIVWDETRPTAIINDEILAVGDQIAGYKVVIINKNKVIVSNGQQNVELNINIEIK